tara:strand:+ start:205 stop:381 length:177 start_codon:yes stop_codon:yes gene_type:complete
MMVRSFYKTNYRSSAAVDLSGSAMFDIRFSRTSKPDSAREGTAVGTEGKNFQIDWPLL